MRRGLFLLVASILLLAFTTPAFAWGWEFCDRGDAPPYASPAQSGQDRAAANGPSQNGQAAAAGGYTGPGKSDIGNHSGTPDGGASRGRIERAYDAGTNK